MMAGKAFSHLIRDGENDLSPKTCSHIKPERIVTGLLLPAHYVYIEY